jgi:ATP-dependent RNA helicase DDX46/PRP5
MVEILVTFSGKITNLRRVTMVVIGVVDPMFDMGFEPQIMRIMGLVWPDSRLVLFSATFPYPLEAVSWDLLID